MKRTGCQSFFVKIYVSESRIKNDEVDFVAIKPDEKIYIQVTETMTSEAVRRRELADCVGINALRNTNQYKAAGSSSVELECPFLRMGRVNFC